MGINYFDIDSSQKGLFASPVRDICYSAASVRSSNCILRNRGVHKTAQSFYNHCTSDKACVSGKALKIPSSGQELLGLSRKDKTEFDRIASKKLGAIPLEVTQNYPYLQKYISLAKGCCVRPETQACANNLIQDPFVEERKLNKQRETNR